MAVRKLRTGATGGGNALERARRVLEVESTAILEVRDRLGEEFERGVDLLMETTGKVVVTGLGKSGIICRKIAATLASTGTPAFFLHAAEAGHGDLGTVFRGDSVLAVSNSGETREVVSMVPLFKRLSLPLLAITGETSSSLARTADVVLDVSVREEACPLALAPTSSTTASLALGDALALALMERRGFREEDFAFLHPDGNLGRRLLRVRELMHTSQELPVVSERATIGEAVEVMSTRRGDHPGGLGHVGVVDATGGLVGVVTDGDLRRLFLLRTTRPDLPITDIMTRSPKTIAASALGAEAVAVMERHSITALFVVDEAHRPYGLIHLHDLLRAGVV